MFDYGLDPTGVMNNIMLLGLAVEERTPLLSVMAIMITGWRYQHPETESVTH